MNEPSQEVRKTKSKPGAAGSIWKGRATKLRQKNSCSYETAAFEQSGVSSDVAQRVGFDLPCGAGRVAALTCPRHVIHYRSRSNP